MLPKIIEKKLGNSLILSLEDELSKILSKRRLGVLRAIVERNPDSIYDLAKFLGRSREAVLRDLKYLEKVGIVEFEKKEEERQRKIPKISKELIIIPLSRKNPFFETIEHTADIGFRASGSTLEEVFENSGLALTDLLVNSSKVCPSLKKEFFIKAEDLKALMYEYLEKILFFFEVERLVFSKFEVGIREKPLRLKCRIWGEKISAKHGFRNEIKAITYHMMDIGEVNGKWMAQIVVDI